MRRRSVLRVVLAATLSAGAVSAQASSGSQLSEAVGRVVCHSKSLTVCEDDFCFASFDGLGSDEMVFDFVQATYVFPAVSAETKPMRVIDVVRTEGHYTVKFGIDLVQRSSNVTFIANVQKGGVVEMSAASRVFYPGTAARSPIIAIDGRTCERAMP